MNMITSVTNNVWRYMGLEAEVILASVAEDSPPLYTVRMRYPRIIHGEILTHRVFSRNGRSSRAVPVPTMLAELRSGTLAGMFTPWHWGKNRKGMQAVEECCEKVSTRSYTGMSREEAWREACDQACEIAEGFHDAGYHKQVVNRLIEPFSYIDVLITATDWLNFFHLRDHADAEPHLRDLAQLVQQAIAAAVPQMLEPGQWHLPYIIEADWEEATRRYTAEWQVLGFLKEVSAARCARISYAPFDGDASYARELERYRLLVTSERIHASPLEHQASPDLMVLSRLDTLDANGHVVVKGDPEFTYLNPELHGNFFGWVQNRKTIPGECAHAT